MYVSYALMYINKKQEAVCMSLKKPIIFIEFNEVNFELLNQYLTDPDFKNRWPSLRKLVQMDMVTTTSEVEYENLEPWIQWASVHTGQTASEHGIFRLGDINKNTSQQIFEKVEQAGCTVGSISAMNVENRLENPAYFIPDPWTVTTTDGSLISNAVYRALYQAVNDNSSGKLTKKTVLFLLYALATRSSISNWAVYVKLVYKVMKKRKWNKALFLDLFMSDLHLSLFNRSTPDLSVVFFNGFAHLQHHYYFSSRYYDGDYSNPSWYIPPGDDPFPDALDVYDVIMNDHFKQGSKAELVIATGLRQKPYTKHKFYYRLSDHAKFISLLGFDTVTVHPRMTRDFLIESETELAAQTLETKLSQLTLNGERLFNMIDNRGASLFVTLTYPYEIKDDDVLMLDDGKTILMRDHVVFVAVKNGMHDDMGYVFSSEPSSDFFELQKTHVANLFGYIYGRLS